MRSFSALALACVALLSVANAVPTAGSSTEGLAKRFTTSADANGACYYSCPDIGSDPSDGNAVIGSQTYCNYPEPDVICRYTSTTGVLVGGYYNENNNGYNGCPATATGHGCSTGTVSKRGFAKPLSALERRLQARQWSPRKAAARLEKKSAVPWLKK